MMSKMRILVWVALPVLIADFTTKRLAVAYLQPPHTPHPVLGDLLRFTLAYNRQGVMGLPVGPYGRWLLIAVTVILLVVLVRLIRAAPARDRLRPVSLALIIGGACGNLLGRLASGRVVDFIDVGTTAWRFWTFNLADVAIDVGVGLLVWSLWRGAPRSPRGSSGALRD
jgi:signal peptidase II